MRIEMKREAELAKRKGLANRTFFALLGMAVTLVLAYLLSIVLFSMEIITPGFFYSELSVPAEVSEGIIHLAVVILLFCGFQLIMMMGFAVLSPEARTRSGKPTFEAKELDYVDQHYNYQAQEQYSEDEYTYSASSYLPESDQKAAVQANQESADGWQPEVYQSGDYRAYEEEYESFGEQYRRDV
jgi:hypothetical protein